MQTVKIQAIDDRTHVFVGDCELKRIISASYEQTSSTAPCFTFETIGLPDIEIDNADICFRFMSETISDATKVICHSFSTDGELYDAFVASIASALKEIPTGTGPYDAAKAVADRIIGREE